jgi:adenylate cyclase
VTALSGRIASVVSPRVLIWLFHLALPIAGLWLVLAQPHLDFMWQDNAAHFWLILVVALVNVALALTIGIAAHRRDDARLYLIGLGFAAAAGFFAIHAFTTPTLVLGTPNAAFVLSTPIGIVLSAAFGLASAADVGPDAQPLSYQHRVPLAFGLGAGMVVFVVASIVPGSPLGQPLPEEQSSILLGLIAVPGILLELVVAALYFRLYRRRPSVVLIAIITAYVLLAEALLAVATSRAWHASWWEWHVLLLLAFGYVAYSAHVQYRREGRSTSLFRALSMEETVRRLRDEYAAALNGLTGAIEAAAETGHPAEIGRLQAELEDRFGLSEGQADVLAEAAGALAAERREVRRLGLFRRYLSPEVATALLDDPTQASLGGGTVPVTVLFADLRGFTSFAEGRDPEAVVRLLNSYFRLVVPGILHEGGTVVQFMGDAIMAIFNAPIPQQDHVLRAARAALSFQARMEENAASLASRAHLGAGADSTALPRFRVGIATGPAVVGNVGSDEVRSFTAIGETVNLAARLQTWAEVGQVVVSPATAERLGANAILRPLGGIELKGVSEPVAAFELVALMP